MALSRNLLKRWNGEFNYGDTVVLEAGDPSIDGLWVVNDNMNKRFKDRGDLLFHRTTRTTGIWRNVKISRLERRPVSILAELHFPNFEFLQASFICCPFFSSTYIMFTVSSFFPNSRECMMKNIRIPLG